MGNMLITFSINWTDPKQSADWANAMITRVNDHIRQQAIEEAEKSIYFLEEQLQSTSLLNAQSVLHSLVEDQTKNIMLANVRDEYAFKIIDPAVVPEKPYKPNMKIRKRWVSYLTHNQFTTRELRRGTAYKILKKIHG